MVPAHPFREQAYSVADFQSLCDKLTLVSGGMSGAITSTRYFMAWLLSTVPSGASLRRMSGTVPADSISQLVKFFLPN